MTTRIYIEELRINAPIGLYDSERAGPQPIIVNLILKLGPDMNAAPAVFLPDLSKAKLSEAERQIVCYESLAGAVSRLAQERHTDLVETLVEAIAALCLTDARVDAVTVRVDKPQAVPAALRVGVAITRKRCEE